MALKGAYQQGLKSTSRLVEPAVNGYHISAQRRQRQVLTTEAAITQSSAPRKVFWTFILEMNRNVTATTASVYTAIIAPLFWGVLFSLRLISGGGGPKISLMVAIVTKI